MKLLKQNSRFRYIENVNSMLTHENRTSIIWAINGACVVYRHINKRT